MAVDPAWKAALLRAIGAPPTPSNLAFLDAWGRAEGGGGYSGTGEGAFNWLNTRRGAGSNWNQPNFAAGIKDTAAALENGLYGNIVNALRSGNTSAAKLASLVEASPWGTKTFPTLNGSSATGPPPVSAPAASARAPGMAQPTAAPGSPLAGVDVQKQLLNMLMAQNSAFAMGKQINPNQGFDMLSLLQNAQKTSQLGVQVDPLVQQQGVHPNANSVVDLAKRYLGTKYVFGGNQPGGFDCSGLVQYVYGLKGIHLPRTTFDQWKTGMSIDRSQLQPGDILFFNTENDPRGPSHEGMYIGGGQFIQSPHTGSSVQISSLSDPYFQQTYVGARRVAG